MEKFSDRKAKLNNDAKVSFPMSKLKQKRNFIDDSINEIVITNQTNISNTSPASICKSNSGLFKLGPVYDNRRSYNPSATGITIFQGGALDQKPGT